MQNILWLVYDNCHISKYLLNRTMVCFCFDTSYFCRDDTLQWWNRLFSNDGYTVNKASYILIEWDQVLIWIPGRQWELCSLGLGHSQALAAESWAPHWSLLPLPCLATSGSEWEQCPTCLGALLIPSLQCVPPAHSILQQSLPYAFWSLGS